MTIRVLALCGGIGGAKLALGLADVVPPDELAILVNTGDDFEHFGLSISPDIDTVVYTLSGRNNAELGWGLADESWGFMDQMRLLGGADWFNLGDRDLALHVVRTERLRAGESLTKITADVATRLGVPPHIWPMSDDPVRTIVDTDEGVLAFQPYFVGRQAQPVVRRLSYQGAERARPHPAAMAALTGDELEAVIICPSNPWLSIAPLLAMPTLRGAIADCAAPVIAVSPIVDGRAIKGPTAKLMAELGLPVSAEAVAAHYRALIDGFVLDDTDLGASPAIGAMGIAATAMPTVMTDRASKAALAQGVLDFAALLRASSAP